MIISPAMLRTFDECQKKYYFQYVEKLNLPQNQLLFEKGKKIHALASYFIKGYSVSELEAGLSDEEISIWKYLKETEYFKYEFVKSEYSLSVKIADYWVGGRLDALVKNKNDYYILDYKTGKIPNNPIYDYQTMIYLLCANKILKNINSLSFVYIDLKNKGQKQIEFSKKLQKEYEDRISTVCKKIKLSEDLSVFLLSNNKCECDYCKFCEKM